MPLSDAQIRAASALDPKNRSDFSVPHLADFKLQVESSAIYFKHLYKPTGYAVLRDSNDVTNYSVNFVSIETEPHRRTAGWYFETFKPYILNGYILTEAYVVDFLVAEPHLYPAALPSWRIQLSYLRNV